MPSKKTYQQLNSELEEIIESIQLGELDVDETVKLYERGIAIIKEMETLLKRAENKIKRIHTGNK